MKKINIAGVPEHFNFPWHLSIENNEFQNVGIDLRWTNVPEGTGKLCQMLRDGSADIAIILTEGIIKDIHANNPSKIIQLYVESPLIWGLHVDKNAPYFTIDDLENKTIAISRYGSGSHLMPFVNAKNQGWNINNLKFKVVNTIDGAVTSLSNGSADYFMWEHFMTKPLVDAGVFRRILDCPTPWPSFVIAVRNDVLKKFPEELKKIVTIINKKTQNFKSIPELDLVLAKQYNLKPDDLKKWLSVTNWSQNNITKQQINQIQNQLIELEIIDKKTTFASLVKVL